MIKSTHYIFLLMMLGLGIFTACQSKNQPLIVNKSPIIPSATPTPIRLPTATDILPTTVSIASLARHSISTVTNTPIPTLTLMPTASQRSQQEEQLTQVPDTLTPTPIPTIPALPIDTAFSLSLPATQYHLLAKASIPDSPESFYAMYVLQDTAIDTLLYNFNYEVCRIIFYAWQQKPATREIYESIYIGSYPAQSIKNREESLPIACQIINWSNSGSYGAYYLNSGVLGSSFSTDNEKELLMLNRFESDINANGLPEFSVLYQSCLNGCVDWGRVSTHFYEVQNDGSIKHISADLPGEIVPYYTLSHKGESGTLLLYDLKSSSKWERTETWWIFEWDGTAYQDATANYADDIRQWGQKRLELIRTQYGNHIGGSRMDFVEILLQYEKAGLQDEAIEIISEITDITHWPKTSFHYQCWLKVLRENAIDEAAHGQPFSLPLDTTILGMFDYPSTCDNIIVESE